MNTAPDMMGHDRETLAFYRHAFSTLVDAGVPFLVGGAFALQRYTGLTRDTKDIDVFVRAADVKRALAAFERAGYLTELTCPHWLAKVYCGDRFVDVIFSSGNGIAVVDDEWFEHAVPEDVMGIHVELCPVEETIWSKAFVMERERFDGADVVHLLRTTAGDLDWPRLLRRFGAHWRVLLAHLVLFGFVYPSERGRVPGRVMAELIGRLLDEVEAGSTDEFICRGTLLSRAQYLADIQHWGYEDPRTGRDGTMTDAETALWTAAALEDAEDIALPPTAKIASDSADTQ